MKETSAKNEIPEHETIGIIWTTVMSLGEWNKKEELVAEQALRHLRIHTQFLQAFTTTDRAELALILKVQEFCYENMNFMKAFQKIILLFYKCKFRNCTLNSQRHLNNFYVELFDLELRVVRQSKFIRVFLELTVAMNSWHSLLYEFRTVCFYKKFKLTFPFLQTFS